MYFIAINSYEDKQTIETVMSHNTKLPHCPCGNRQDFLRDIEARCTTLLSSSLYKETTFEVEHLCDVCSISVFKYTLLDIPSFLSSEATPVRLPLQGQ